jgi:bacillolysin
MSRRTLVGLSAAALVLVSITTWPTQAGSATTPRPTKAGTPSGSFALSGAEAEAFRLPGDAVQVWRSTRPDGSTATRYQQMVDGASVIGGQITVLRDASGKVTAAIGAYFDNLRAENSVKLTGAEVRRDLKSRIGARGTWSTELRLDPETGRFVYQLDSIRTAQHPVRWIDAANGMVRKAYDALAEGDGLGVKGDTKQVDTTPTDGGFLLRTPDGRQITYDFGNDKKITPVVMFDPDDTWDRTHPTFLSPDQRPGVDAHYYAGVVDDFYADTFGRDSIDDEGMTIISAVHFLHNYCNAFWNGAYMTYGDGVPKQGCLPLSGGLDVVGHELTHGVTQFTSNLIYENESGALNEAFSDIIGSTIEFYADDNGLDPTVAPDWRIGEDVIPTLGIRNMGDPQEFGDPDHYSERFTGEADNGGVHTNSGIANHAYYLAVNGGQNAGCGGSPSGHTHTADCDVTVPAVGLDTAAQVFYDGFTSLPEFGNFCDARNATVAVAGAAASSISAAWAAVGVHAGCTPGTPPPPPCEGDDTASIPFGTPHPYGNNGDCTWTYDNGSPGFAFHFSLLDTEEDFDFVHVKDGDGNVLATYTGTFRRGATSPCIPTSTGSVQFTSDAFVVAQGFTVDAVVPC